MAINSRPNLTFYLFPDSLVMIIVRVGVDLYAMLILLKPYL